MIIVGLPVCKSYVLRKGKGKGLDTCYSATYMSQTRDQQRFTVSEVAAHWHEPMVPQHEDKGEGLDICHSTVFPSQLTISSALQSWK